MNFSRAICTVLVVFVSSTAWAKESIEERGRAIFSENKGAVVTVMLVLKQQISFPGSPSQDRESKTEATGTVISPDGLTVLSLSETDPSSILEAVMAGSSQARGVKMDTEVRDIRILLEDGTELPAEVILRDRDLDVAFVRPTEKPEEPLQYVSLEDDAEPQILDQVVSINRMGQVAGRTHSASLERIDAVVTKPRTFYIPGKDPTNTALGSPAFSLEGKIVGLFLIRTIKASSTSALGGMFGGISESIMTVVVPAADLLEGAVQAPPFEE